MFSYISGMPILQAHGLSLLQIGFDPEQFAKLLPDQQQEFVRYHVARVLAGASSASEEWERLGLRVNLKPWTPKAVDHGTDRHRSQMRKGTG